MKDPFPPSRMAAVLAFSATQQFYSLIEVANKIVPALAPLTCDPEKQVSCFYKFILYYYFFFIIRIFYS